MPLIAGVDGAKGGWIAALLDTDTRELRSRYLPSIQDLFAAETPAVVAKDIPIGLNDKQPRLCDVEARNLLGPRKNSVFPAPLRPALACRTRLEAQDISLQLCGKGVGAQSFGIYSKVKEVDDLLRDNPALQSVVFEIHPELCFWAMNGNTPMSNPKRANSGFQERLSIVEAHFGPAAFRTIRTEHSHGKVADDDILDSLAALWTAERILNGETSSVPAEDVRDAVGLRMAMWY